MTLIQIFLISLAIPSLLLAKIEPIYSIKELESIEVRDNTLAAFDIDDTLTILHEPAFQRPNFKTHHSQLFSEIMETLTIEERLLAFTLPLLMVEGDLIEAEAPAIIKQLQNKGVKTIGLTAAMACRIESSYVEDRRIEELKRVGIDFSFCELQDTYTNFKTPILGSYPLIKNGIIFTNDNDKGEVLIEFLQTLMWQPTLIVFVDDRIEHLHSVEKALATYYPHIEFRGFHFQPDRIPYQETSPENFLAQWLKCMTQAKEILEKQQAIRS